MRQNQIRGNGSLRCLQKELGLLERKVFYSYSLILQTSLTELRASQLMVFMKKLHPVKTGWQSVCCAPMDRCMFWDCFKDVIPVISPQCEAWLFCVQSQHTNLREFQVRSQQRGVCLRTKTDKVLKELRNCQAFWYWIWSCFTLLQVCGSLNTDSIVAFKLLINISEFGYNVGIYVSPQERWDR